MADAFPGATLESHRQPDGRFTLAFHQPGLLRPLSAAELSDGTLRYLLWIAALLTPRPPALMVLNEPENSLHPDLIPALARLILRTARQSQVWVISHAQALVDPLAAHADCRHIALAKELGQTLIPTQGLLTTPPWHWPDGD